MKKLILLLSLISFSTFAQTYEGDWVTHDGHEVYFTKVDSTYYSHTEEKFVFPNGNLSHTINQSVKFTVNPEGKIEGSVDFYDSRGCSFRDYKVSGELHSENEMSILMAVPRYQFRRITVGYPGRYYDRPVFCWSPYGHYRYICGYERMPQSSHTECHLLEKVDVPVTLKR